MDSKRVNVFVQVNTVKGNRYLDDCGKIMNDFDEEFPIKGIQADNFGGNTLSMINATSQIRQVKVTTQVIWIHFEVPDTNQYIVDHASRIIEAVCQRIEVKHYNRIAIRSQHLIFDSDVRGIIRRAREWSFAPTLLTTLGARTPPLEASENDLADGFHVIYPVVDGDMQITVQMGPAQSQEESKDPPMPKEGLLLDCDVYRTGTFSHAEFRRFARIAAAWSGDKTNAIISALRG